MRLSYLLFLSLCLPALSHAQLFTFGAKGGMTTLTPLGKSDDGVPFVLGPSVNIRLLPMLSIETGVLFQGMGQRSDFSAFYFPENALTIVSMRQKAHAVEIPVLAKLALPVGGRIWRPFVTAGPSIRRTSVNGRFVSSVLSGAPISNTNYPPSNTHQVDWGFDPTAGVGVDFKAGRFHLEPEIRYSYWSAGTDLPVRKNQVNLLLGFRF